jgi:3-oxoacyl-[acyl-carrier-protein] synthase-1
MKPLTITSYTTTTSLGAGNQANWQKLAAGETGLVVCQFDGIDDLPTWVGEVAAVDQVQLPAALASFDCRNNRLAWLGLQQDGFMDSVAAAVNRYGSHRVAVFMGTSTSGIHQTELAYRQIDNDALPDWYHYQGTHNAYSIAEFTRQALQLEGLASSISTACSSSAKVFACAYRAMEAGFCDAAVVGGVDSLCLTTLYGFNSLQLVASDICRPSDANRSGLSIGEAAGFALLEKHSADSPLCLLGYGESSDAYHMSSPHPDGEGAVMAMQAALSSASLQPADIDYINLHGTGTSSNDLAESNAVCKLLGEQTPCSSTKGWTGHTLGAAGIVEANFSALCIANGFIPQSLNTRTVDPAIKANIALHQQSRAVAKVLSNSFGFGGTNCSLILGGSCSAIHSNTEAGVQC